ncbi:UNVERIFIED_CONTAM: hypothetical protein Sindi_0051200 [Sesamum indicum]
MVYRRYLESAGFPQDDHWSLNIEQRFMWMILDDNTRAPMRDDAFAEAQMGHWARRLHRYFGYPYTRDQVHDKFYEFKNRFRQFHGITQIPGIYYDIETFTMVFPVELRPCASRYYEYSKPHYPSMLEVWGPIRLPGVPIEAQSKAENNESGNIVRNLVRGSMDAPIVISDSTAPSGPCASGDGGPTLARNTLVAARRSLDMGSEVGVIGSWTDYIRRIRMQSERGAQTYSEGDSTARSPRP